MEITVKNNNPMFKQLLASELPTGVEIVHHPQIERRDINIALNFNFDITFNLNLAILSIPVFVDWLISKSRSVEGNRTIQIESKKISIDDPEAIELVTKEIENKKQGK